MLERVRAGVAVERLLFNFDLLFSSRVTEPFEEKRFQKSHASQKILKTVTDLVYKPFTAKIWPKFINIHYFLSTFILTTVF